METNLERMRFSSVMTAKISRLSGKESIWPRPRFFEMVGALQILRQSGSDRSPPPA